MLKRQTAGSATQNYYNSESYYTREQRGHILRALIFIVVLILLGEAAYIYTNKDEVYKNYLVSRVSDPVTTLKKHAIYIYSQTNCAQCRDVAEELRKNGILYREFYIDTDPIRKSEMTQLVNYKFPEEKKVVLPIIRVNNEVLMGNVSLRELAAFAEKR
jgi:glutaredoxin